MLFSFFCTPSLSYATEMNGMVDEITPTQLNSDRQDTVTINLRSKEGNDLFSSNLSYELLLCRPGADINNAGLCNVENRTAITSTQLTFQFKLSGEYKKSGTFNYKVYIRKGGESTASAAKNPIFISSFTVAPPASGNGKLPVFTLPDTVQEGSFPPVTFINVVAETDYTIWWDQDQTAWKANFKFPANQITGDPPQTRTSMNSVGKGARSEPYKVCMARFTAAPGGSVVNKNCDYSLYVKVVKDITGITPGTASSDPTVGGASPSTTTIKWPPVIDKSNQQCYVQSGTDIRINKVTNIASDTKYFTWWHGEKGGVCNDSRICPTSDSKGTELSFTIPGSATKDKTGQQKFCISTDKDKFVEPDTINTDGCKDDNSITFEFSSLPPTAADKSCAGVISKAPPPPPAPCQTSQGTKDDSTGLCLSLNTALGKIELEPSKLISSILGMLLSLAGGIALFIIIRSGYTLMTSQGNPEKVKEAREAITSAVVGILFMVFSVIILQVIGVDILKIPGLT